MKSDRSRVIIIGAGFGGLYAAQTFRNKPVDVLLIDQQNFHTFTPLLYQVATAGLEAEEIAYPVRGIFRNRSNVTFMMGKVTAIDPAEKTVSVRTNGNVRQEAYDYLIVAAGSVTDFFGNDSIAQESFELKTLDHAVLLRNHILKMFERAAWEEDENYRKALTTLVVVGGGPTGIETAGALFELYEHVLSKEYRNLSPRIVLIEARNNLLTPFPKDLQESAYEQLKSLGVEVILGRGVSETGENYVRLNDDTEIETHTLIWEAGVKASPLAQMLTSKLQRNGRVPVMPTMQAEGLENVYVVGDMAYLEDETGQPYPMMIPAAKQQGILAANNILRRMAGWQQQSFSFVDRGIMATIGRSRAVAYLFHRIPLTGFIAWVAWLGLHLLTLMGFRNRLNVLVNWLWNYVTYDRSVRVILEPQPAEKAQPLREFEQSETPVLVE